MTVVTPDIHGLVIIDKPEHMTSAGVVSRVKKILNAKKVGHTGTLDPFATGVLICCINRATRLARFLLGGEKKYQALLHLGIETDTQDATGKIISTQQTTAVTEAEIKAVFQSFRGPVEQVPPVFSALKHQGVPLYKHARRGKPVQKPARQIVIYDLHILEIHWPFIRFETTCSAGTYIRTLGADIGRALGCGGHLKALRRIESAGFSISHAMTLTQLEERAGSQEFSRFSVAMAAALKDMRVITADSDLKQKIANGLPLAPKDIAWKSTVNCGKFLKIITSDDALLAVIEQINEHDNYRYCCVFNNTSGLN